MSPIPETGPIVNIRVSTTLFHPRQPRKGAQKQSTLRPNTLFERCPPALNPALPWGTEQRGARPRLGGSGFSSWDWREWEAPPPFISMAHARLPSTVHKNASSQVQTSNPECSRCVLKLPVHRICIRGDSCGLGTLKYPRMHFAFPGFEIWVQKYNI